MDKTVGGSGFPAYCEMRIVQRAGVYEIACDPGITPGGSVMQ